LFELNRTLSNGGDTNFLTHQASKVHKTKVEELKKKPAVIINFFGPLLKPQAISLSTALASSSQTQLQDTEKVVIDVDESPILDPASPEKAVEGGPLDSPLVQDVTFLSRSP
jgi:hypothetical protein